MGISANAVDRLFVDRLVSLVRRLSAQDPPEKAPSAAECRFCDISDTDCPERVSGAALEGTTEDF